MLAHELSHAYTDYLDLVNETTASTWEHERRAMRAENDIRFKLFRVDPSSSDLYPRPGYIAGHADLGATAEDAWGEYRRRAASGQAPAYP